MGKKQGSVPILVSAGGREVVVALSGVSYLRQVLKFALATRLQFSFPFLLVLAQRVNKCIRHGQVPIPLVIGGHSIPGTLVGAAQGQRIFVCFLVIFPIFAFGPITGIDFPGFVFILLASK